MSYLGNTPVTQSFISGTDSFVVGATAQTVFTLSRSVASINDIQVLNNATVLPPNNNVYTVSASTLTLATGVANTTLYVRYLSTVTQQLTPATGSVGLQQLSALGTPLSTTFLSSNGSSLQWTMVDISTADVTGILGISNGGTGASTQQAAINNLVGTVATARTFLRSDGTNATMSAIQVADVPTLNQNTTGNAANVTGTVAITNGGTGATTQQGALNAVAGAQAAGRYLRSDGTNTSLSQINGADSFVSPVSIANGGTGAATAATAATNLNLGTTSNAVFNQVSDVKGELRTIVQNAQTGAYTLVLGDAGKHISITTGGVTVPANVFTTAGQAVTIWNNSAGAQTITQASGVTIYNAADGTSGNRTLSGRGICTILYVGTNTFSISGAGLS